MSTIDVKTIGGNPNSAITDANYDSWLAVQIDTSAANSNISPINYNLTSNTADRDDVYGVLGTKASSTESRAEDTIIRGGVVPIQFAATYSAADHQGRRVVASTTAGVVQVHSSDPTMGRGKIVGGGTMTIKGTTRNIVYVDLDAN